MNILTQIISIVISFIYGIIIHYLINISKKILNCNNKYMKIIYNLLFCLNCSLLYLIIMKEINKGSIKLIFILIIIFGYYFGKKIISNYVKLFIETRNKKK